MTIQNIVATFTSGRRLDTLAQLVRLAPNAEYDPHRFHAAIFRVRLLAGAAAAPPPHNSRPRRQHSVTALVFTSGRVVLAGAKSLAEVRAGATAIVRTLNAALRRLHSTATTTTRTVDDPHQRRRPRWRACVLGELRVRNMVASFAATQAAGARLNVERLCAHLNNERRRQKKRDDDGGESAALKTTVAAPAEALVLEACFEPEIFPGLRCRLRVALASDSSGEDNDDYDDDGNIIAAAAASVSALIFRSARCIITGARCERTLRAAHHALCALIERSRVLSDQ